MKFRTCFVSNSSSSSFILNAGSIEEAKEMLAECIAKFLDQKETHEKHLRQAREFLNNRLRLDAIAMFKHDGSHSFNELSKMLWTDSPERILKDDDKGKIVMVDHDRGDSITSWFVDEESWKDYDSDVEAIRKIFNEAGIERR